jgi:hypothetical protein
MTGTKKWLQVVYLEVMAVTYGAGVPTVGGYAVKFVTAETVLTLIWRRLRRITDG